MVSSVNIHSWEKLPKPCMALKEQAFQLFSNILISVENAEKVLFCSSDLLPVWAVARSESLEAHCCLPQAFQELLTWKTLKDKKGRGNKCPFYQGWPKQSDCCPRAVFTEHRGRMDICHDDIGTLCHCCESLPGTPGSLRLGTLKALSASKLGVKGSLFILDSNALIFGDWEDLGLGTYCSLFLPWQEVRSTEHLKQGRMEMCQRPESLIAHLEQTFVGFGKLWDGCSHLLHDLPLFSCTLFPFLLLVVSFVALCSLLWIDMLLKTKYQRN